jgi:hypothetical protein
MYIAYIFCMVYIQAQKAGNKVWINKLKRAHSQHSLAECSRLVVQQKPTSVPPPPPHLLSWQQPVVQYGDRSPKFICAPYHVMCTHSCTHLLRPCNYQLPPAFGLVLRGGYWSAAYQIVTSCNQRRKEVD